MYKIYYIPKGVIANVWTKNMAMKGNHTHITLQGECLQMAFFVRKITVSI